MAYGDIGLIVAIWVVIFDEIVKASRETGIGRMRLVGVILVSCQDRFADLVKSPYLRGAGD